MKSKSANSHPTLDLHGRKTDDVPDLVDRFLHQHIKKGTPRVRVMTGKGTGKILTVTRDYLKRGGFPFQFEKENGQVNEGVLLVFLE